MTRDELTQLAREAGFCGIDGSNPSLRRLANLIEAAARADEREQCARVCEAFDACDPSHIATFIRARGETK